MQAQLMKTDKVTVSRLRTTRCSEIDQAKAVQSKSKMEDWEGAMLTEHAIQTDLYNRNITPL